MYVKIYISAKYNFSCEIVNMLYVSAGFLDDGELKPPKHVIF